MHRIQTLLRRLHELAAQHEKNTEIDIDLMLDYTRVLYADLLDWRKNIAFKVPVENEPTLDELTAAMEKEEKMHESNAQEEKVVYNLQTEPAKRNIRNNIGINDKFLFTSELFNNDSELYNTTLDFINEMENIEEAKEWLHTRFAWGEDNEVANSFYAMVNSSFEAI